MKRFVLLLTLASGRFVLVRHVHFAVVGDVFRILEVFSINRASSAYVLPRWTLFFATPFLYFARTSKVFTFLFASQNKFL